MFNVLVNNNLFDKNNFRLLSLNNDYDNKMLLFILLSNYNQNNSSINLTEFSSHDLNKITNTLKKDLNKYVKNKYNINYLNLNNKNHLNILSNLFEINLKIFNKNFNDTKFMSNTNHNKSMYFLKRNNKLHLVSTKNKNNIQYYYNNILYGGYNPREYEEDIKIIQDIVVRISDNQETDLTIGLFEHYTPFSSFYSLEQANKFLSIQGDKIEQSGKYLEPLKEIYTATFTNIFRTDIYKIINNINIELEKFVKELKKQSFFNIDGCKLIIGGGDCFNSFLHNNDNKPISPDIDVKLVIESPEARYLHNQSYKNDNEKKQYTLLFNLSLLLIRNRLYQILDVIVNDMNNNLNYYNKKFINSYRALLDYMQYKGYIKTDVINVEFESFKTKYNKKIKLFKKRFNHMESGYTNKKKLDLPFRINNVLLYSIDGIFDDDMSWSGIAGILDIVVSFPTHTGYMFEKQYEPYEYSYKEKDTDIKLDKLYRMAKDYYINKDNLKMVDYGLRTANKKILKDFTRILILIKSDIENNISNKDNIVKKIIIKLNELKNIDDYQSNINEIDNMLEYIRTCLNYNLTGGTKTERNNNSKNPILSKDFESFCSLNNIFKSIDYNFDTDDENIYVEEIINNSNNSNNSKQTGGFIKNPNYLNQIEVSYKLPKALYYIISEKILPNNPNSNKILTPIINFNEKTNTLGPDIKNINYEKLTELTEGIPDNRSSQLSNPLILNELFNSDALYRFKNTSYNRWSKEDNGKLEIKPDIVQLLTNITTLLNTNPNNIQKLYYFDITNNDVTNNTSNNVYNKLINREVAKCLMHTFIHSLSPEFMQIDNIYRRFLKNKGKKRTVNNNNVVNSSIQDIKQIDELKPILNLYNKIKQISEL
jgi:hypothetical protein